MLIDEQQYCLIVYSDLYGVFPTTYTEKVYFKGRPVKLEPHEVITMSEEVVKTTLDANYRQRIIQAQIFDRYEMKLITSENYAIETLKYADSITAYSFNEKKEYHPVIEEVTKNKISGSTFQEVTITFWDKNTDNYYNGQPVINHLRSDALLARGYGAATLTKVTLDQLNHDTWTTDYNFYTALYMVKSVETANKEESDLNGELINTRLSIKTKREITLYLTEADAYNLAYYGNLCNSYNGRIQVSEKGGALPMQVELPEINCEQVKGAVDLWKCTIKFTQGVLNNLTYST